MNFGLSEGLRNAETLSSFALVFSFSAKVTDVYWDQIARSRQVNV